MALRHPITPAGQVPKSQRDTKPENPGEALIVLPLPTRALSPNGRAHYQEKARKVAAYRAQAKRAASPQVFGPPWERVTARATFFHKVRRRRDDVNHLAMLKPAYDGIVDAGLIVDDDSEHLRTLGASFEIDKHNPRVELLIVRVS